MAPEAPDRAGGVDSVVATSADSRPRAWSPPAWLRGGDTIVLAALLLTVIAASVLVEGFASGRNWGFLLLDAIPIALIALPMTLIVVTAEIDLSVASILGLTSAVMGQLWIGGLPLELILLLCLLLGGVLGAVNGVATTVFGLPSLAVTIGTLALYRGLAFVVLGDRAVADFPSSWTGGATDPIPGTSIPWVVAVVAVVAVAAGVVLHATPVGRALYAMGNNTEAATFAGIPVARTKFWLYVASGVVAAAAGVFWTFRYASARADNGTGLELSVVAAVLLGGVSIFGGRGRIVGALAGVLLLAVLRNALPLARVSADVLTMVTGALLIVSVVGPNLAHKLRASRQRPGRLATAVPGTTPNEGDSTQ